MTDPQTPSTNAPAEPERVELDLRDHDNGSEVSDVRRDPEPTAPVHDGPEEMVSRRQASARFGLDPDVLRRLEKRGELTPSRKTSRGPVYFAVSDLERVAAEHAREADDRPLTGGLVLPPERLWEMVEGARRDAVEACTRASALEAEVKVLRAMVERLLAERDEAPTRQPGETTAERARRWSGQWEQHEREQQRLQQQQHEASTRGSWWPRRS